MYVSVLCNALSNKCRLVYVYPHFAHNILNFELFEFHVYNKALTCLFLHFHADYARIISPTQSVCAHYNRLVYYVKYATAAYGWRTDTYGNGLRGLATSLGRMWSVSNNTSVLF